MQNLIHQFHVGPTCTECKNSRRASKFHLPLLSFQKCKQRFCKQCTCKADATTVKPSTSTNGTINTEEDINFLWDSHKKLQRNWIVPKRENVEQSYLRNEISHNDIPFPATLTENQATISNFKIVLLCPWT